MTNIKQSEARIMVYLSNVNNQIKYATIMSAKLRMDYNYLLRILNGMKAKKWVRTIQSHNKIMYELNKSAPLEAGKLVL